MYRLSPEQQAVVARAAFLADEEIAPHAERVDREGAFPSESIAALGREGFLGLTVPAAFGGMGQNLRVACAVLDELGRRCASTAMIYVMHLCGIACYLVDPERTGEALRAAAAGRHLSTLAWSEKGSRSQFWAPVSEAVADGEYVVLNAEKSFVTSAGHADGMVATTRAAGAAGPSEITLYLVRGDDPGVSVSGPWEALGMRGNASAPVSFRDVRLGPERRLTEPGRALDVMLGVVLPVFQLGIAAISVGLAEAAVQVTQSHLTGTGFQHQGTRLADLPNLRARLARMRIETDRARSHLVSVIDAVENPGPATQLLVLEVRAAAAETAMRVTEIGMRACGGAAFGKALPLERYFRDARASVVMAPTTDHVHEFIGRALCGMEVLA